MRSFMNCYRTHTCGELRAGDTGKQVKIAGWIHRKRNLGNLCFVDLRDHYGITQCVIDSSSDLFEKSIICVRKASFPWKGKLSNAKASTKTCLPGILN